MQGINIKAENLKRKLEKGEVKFSYVKVDGTLREARGTTKMEMIPDDLCDPSKVDSILHPKDHEVKCVAYFDLDKNDWRSIAEGQEISMDAEDLMSPYDKPNLTEDEITLMLYIYGSLKDKWLSSLIELIMTATPQQAAELSLSFKSLVRVCRKYESDYEYSETLRRNWYKLIN
jgi:hypothetical protein